MYIKHARFLLYTISIFGFLIFPAVAETDDRYSCKEHGENISHTMGADIAIEAFYEFRGDGDEDGSFLTDLRKEHPSTLHELEVFVASDCSEDDLEIHAHDSAETHQKTMPH